MSNTVTEENPVPGRSDVYIDRSSDPDGEGNYHDTPGIALFVKRPEGTEAYWFFGCWDYYDNDHRISAGELRRGGLSAMLDAACPDGRVPRMEDFNAELRGLLATLVNDQEEKMERQSLEIEVERKLECFANAVSWIAVSPRGFWNEMTFYAVRVNEGQMADKVLTDSEHAAKVTEAQVRTFLLGDAHPDWADRAMGCRSSIVGGVEPKLTWLDE